MDSCGIHAIRNYARYPCMVLDFHRTSWTCTCSCTNPMDSFDSYRLLFNIKDPLKTPLLMNSYGFRKMLLDLLRKHSGSDLKCEIAAAGRLIWNSRIHPCLLLCILIYPTPWNSYGNCVEEMRTWQPTISNMAKTSGQGVQGWQKTRNEPNENTE